MSDKEDRESHPSYGLVSFNKVSGNPGRLFGSPITNHYSYVSLRISKGERIYSNAKEWYYGGLRGDIIEVNLSAAQFSELLTTMNVGSGVPCTITYRDGQKVPSPPDVKSEVEKVRSSFKEDMKDIVARIKKDKEELNVLLQKKSLTQTDKKQISDIVARVQMHIECNMPFMLEQFEEASEKVVTHAKAEIDNFITTNVVAEGLRSIASQMAQTNQLPEHKKEPSDE